MPGTIIENLSGKKLTILVTSFFLCQIACFLVGGLVSPKPSNTDNILGSKCLIEKGSENSWYYIWGKGACKPIDIHSLYNEEDTKIANKLVFIFQIPSPKEGIFLDYSRWQQNLVGLLHLDVLYFPDYEMTKNTILTLDLKLGYRNKGDHDNDWKLYSSSVEQRLLDCDVGKKSLGYPYNCSTVPLFELGSLHHDYYLINVKLPVDYQKGINTNLGHIDDMWLVAINQTGGFTKVWMSLKCIFTPFILGILIWFGKRVSELQRSPSLLEYMLFLLGCTLSFLNVPVELLTLEYDLPFMLLFSDIRQGIFYAALLSFWLIFAAEHMLDNPDSNIKTYWKHLSGVGIGCVALLLFDLCERGIHLKNPFYSIWVTDAGTKIASAFLVIGGASLFAYFSILCYMVWKVYCNMRAKKSSLPAMSQARRLHYSGIIYRFNFLMATTLICALLTMFAFFLGQLCEGQWKWDDNQHLEYTSAFFTGVYGMWNIYIFALMVLYAPSHKKWPSQSELAPVANEIEFSHIDPEPSENSSLTTFVRKSALD